MKLEFHILDAGPKKYGDCILCRKGQQLILIDGGHPGDETARTGKNGIPRPALQEQIAAILKKKPPFKLKLLVVTHAHLDHIGCLPSLIEKGIITADWALVADEKYGWGNHVESDGATDAIAESANARAVLAALREDAIPNLSDAAEVEEFLADAATLESRYDEMLKTLQANGTKIVRYGRNSTTKLKAAFNTWKLEILGPTKQHLVTCADEVRRGLSDAAAEIQGALDSANLTDADEADAVELYRHLLQTPQLADASSSRPGDALNDQSIVLAFGPPGERVLLAGDMQFVSPGFTAIKPAMRALWATVKDHGPYALIKTCHHTSHNAINEAWVDDMGADAILVHSGGEQDDDHPHELDVLEERATRTPGRWFRNDRNGRVSCVVENGKVTVKQERGTADDFTPNVKEDTAGEPPAIVPPPQPVIEVAPPAATPQFSVGDSVEVTVRIPRQGARVTLTVEVHPTSDGGGGPPNPKVPSGQSQELGGGRAFFKLLCVTDRARLAKNVGAAAADEAIEMLRRAGLDVIASLPHGQHGSVAIRGAVLAQLRQAAQTGDPYVGVLLIGGHDVVPHVVVDTLPPEMRKMMQQNPPSFRDEDNYIVWSDHPYGDVVEAGANEIPVSRVPDGHSANFLLAALRAPARAPSDDAVFALRNLNRPFAEEIFRTHLRRGKCLTSARTGPRDVPRDAVNAHRIYLMLHGAAHDATAFSGEAAEDDDTQVPAFDVASLPDACPGAVVFTGCCWGALAVDTLAARLAPHASVAARSPATSLALGFLARGARAFIGCTGSHYSPGKKPYTFFGGPLHDAFWQAMNEPGMPPALALHQARIAYLNNIPHGRVELTEQAIEYKIFHQFTCLGLGW